MSVYLHDIPLPEAQTRIELALKAAGIWKTLGVDKIPLDEYAIGRVTANTIWA